jgi:hypothetical protein
MKVNKFDNFNKKFNLGDYVIAGLDVNKSSSIYHPNYTEYEKFIETTPGILKTISHNYSAIKYYNIPKNIKSFFSMNGFIVLSYTPLRLATPEEIERLNIEINTNKYNL